jgi:hypothetical protein
LSHGSARLIPPPYPLFMKPLSATRGRRKVRAVLVAVAGVLLASGTFLGVASIAFADAKPAVNYDDPAIPKSQRPANINPHKAPVLNPPEGLREQSAPKSREQEIHDAKEFAAKNPGTAVICYASDGSIIGLAVVDKVDKNAPLTGASAICQRGWPGSHA